MSPKVATKVTKAKNAKPNKFKIGEKILCYEGAHLYDAKCVNLKTDTDGAKYLIHFNKWKSKYDTWVPESRVLKFNEKNVKLQQELRQKRKKSSTKSEDVTSETSDKQTSKKSKVSKWNISESSKNSSVANQSLKNLTTPCFISKKDDFLNTNEVKIRIPEDLKQILVDDWEEITGHAKILVLPTKFNIDKILSDYFIQKTQASKLPLNHTIEGYNNFLSNIRKYFNFLLEKQLLYPMEREQLAYFKENYDSLIRNLKSDENVSSHKESRRAWRKYKKSHSKKAPQTGKSEDVGVSGTGAEKELNPPICVDTNSQSSSPTSESSTSNEVSSTNSLEMCPSSKEQQTTCPRSDLAILSTAVKGSDCKVDFTKLYGANHLLRLFSKLGHFLFYTDLSEERLALLNSYIYDFLKYLSKNIYTYSSDLDSDYIESNNLIMSIKINN